MMSPRSVILALEIAQHRVGVSGCQSYRLRGVERDRELWLGGASAAAGPAAPVVELERVDVRAALRARIDVPVHERR